jgi:hypothetical protein
MRAQQLSEADAMRLLAAFSVVLEAAPMALDALRICLTPANNTDARNNIGLLLTNASTAFERLLSWLALPLYRHVFASWQSDAPSQPRC